MIKKIDIITSTCIPLPQENVDTDQIIPARFLKAVSREGFGENLFRDWRFDKTGQPIQDFILNNPLYSGSILVAGKNFGSGSSREHAAWAIAGYGFQVGNCLRAISYQFIQTYFFEPTIDRYSQFERANHYRRHKRRIGTFRNKSLQKELFAQRI